MDMLRFKAFRGVWDAKTASRTLSAVYIDDAPGFYTYTGNHAHQTAIPHKVKLASCNLRHV